MQLFFPLLVLLSGELLLLSSVMTLHRGGENFLSGIFLVATISEHAPH